MTRTMAAIAGAVLIALATVGLSPAARGGDGQRQVQGDQSRRYATAATGACRVRYAATTWNNGFTANVTINNTGPAPVRGWRLQWVWPGTQQLASVWNATVTQMGTRVTARNASWNPAIAPGGSVRFGFQGTYGRTNARPAWFALNGTSCAVG
ncbi:MAG TPA: cellulose-binding domain-containing protein [Streptosporangiaceae bacterium]